MTESPNGKTSSAKDLLEKLKKGLDSFEEQVGLPALSIDNEVHRYLKMSRAELEKLIPDECGCGAYLLRKFAFHLQRAYGRESAKFKYIERQIRKVVAAEVSQYRAASAEERREQAILGNEHASALAGYRNYHEARLEQLAFLGNSVSAMAGSLDELQRTKRSQRA